MNKIREALEMALEFYEKNELFGHMEETQKAITLLDKISRILSISNNEEIEAIKKGEKL